MTLKWGWMMMWTLYIWLVLDLLHPKLHTELKRIPTSTMGCLEHLSRRRHSFDSLAAGFAFRFMAVIIHCPRCLAELVWWGALYHMARANCLFCSPALREFPMREGAQSSEVCLSKHFFLASWSSQPRPQPGHPSWDDSEFFVTSGFCVSAVAVTFSTR